MEYIYYVLALTAYARQKGISLPENPNYKLTATELYTIDPLFAYKSGRDVSQGIVGKDVFIGEKEYIHKRPCCQLAGKRLCYKNGV